MVRRLRVYSERDCSSHGFDLPFGFDFVRLFSREPRGMPGARNRTSIEPNTVQPWYNRTTSPKLTRLKSHYSLQSTLCELSLRPTEAGGGSFDGVQGFVWLAREPTTSCTTNAATSGLLQ